MRIGPADGRPILFLPPLLEEMNRTRALIAAVMRRLAASGFCCSLPDLPGTGESETPLEAVIWDDWRAAAASAAAESGPRTILVAIRGGCLLDDVPAAARWRLAPVDGASLVRDLERSGLVAGGGSAGYAPSPSLLEPLRAATCASAAPLRTVRLASDRGQADCRIDGPPLWRRSEPQGSDPLAEAMAADIEDWAEACAAC
jgi:pimeloyl-ACP methyl ester carboxylesterase